MNLQGLPNLQLVSLQDGKLLFARHNEEKKDVITEETESKRNYKTFVIMRNFSQLNLNFLNLTLRYRTKPFPNPYFLSKNNCIFSSSSSPVMESAYWELQQSLLESAWKFLQNFCAKAEENNDNRKKRTKKKVYKYMHSTKTCLRENAVFL